MRLIRGTQKHEGKGVRMEGKKTLGKEGMAGRFVGYEVQKGRKERREVRMERGGGETIGVKEREKREGSI